MPEGQKRIEYEDRKYIERKLDERFSMTYISTGVGVHVTTLKREIVRNRVVKEGRINVRRRRNVCKYRAICTVSGICNPYCQGECKSCGKHDCTVNCELFEPKHCERLDSKPYVCNGCELLDCGGACDCQRMFYDAKAAQEKADDRQSESRRKIALTEAEIAEITKKLKPLLKKGHSPAHIWRSNPGMLPISVRTFYNYVEQEYFEELKMYLPKYVRYPRNRKRHAPCANKQEKACYEGRTFNDLEALSEEEKALAVELDCVESARGSNKVILTLLFRDTRFQLMVLLRAHNREEVAHSLDEIEEAIGLERFRAVFGTQLTDRGKEFGDPDLIESSCTKPGEKRCKVFYCDATRSDQKGRCEKNHVELRRVIPKKTVFRFMTQADVSLAASHVNSYSRKILDGQTPYDLAVARVPVELLEKYGIAKIPPNEIILKPSLLPHLF